jgi:rhodanese-related sulfurtransferase
MSFKNNFFYSIFRTIFEAKIIILIIKIYFKKLVDVLNGRFSDQIDEYVIIDSRYPYEYEGGHIANALNIYTKDKLYLEMFIKRLNFKCSNTHHHRLLSTSASTTCLSNTQPVHIDRNSQSFSNGCLTRFDKECNSLDNLDNEDDQFYAVNQMETSRSWTCAESLNTTLNNSTLNQSNHLQNSASKLNTTNNSDTTNNPSPNPNKRVIVIFHCEFSSERGPSLLRFLRNKDRALNEDVYPNLHYPELYLLEGGYKSFYENFKVVLFCCCCC